MASLRAPRCPEFVKTQGTVQPRFPGHCRKAEMLSAWAKRALRDVSEMEQTVWRPSLKVTDELKLASNGSLPFEVSDLGNSYRRIRGRKYAN